MPYNSKSRRFWEIDFLRGTAIVLMIIFHFLFYLNLFGKTDLDLDKGLIKVMHVIIQLLFISLSGISVILFSSRYDGKEKYKKIMKRGFKIFCYGIFITLITLILFDEGTIYFGILHMIGASIMLSLFFLRFKILNIIIGTSLFVLKNIVGKVVVDIRYLIPFGLVYKGFYSYDYYPLFPWFGLFLIGLGLGNILYKDKKRHNILGYLKHYPDKSLSSICFLGRNSLLIYFLHIPIVMFIAWIL